ncbi:MAG: O-antigen ligase family protein, partial [Dehalococcoidia bacterium]|nr:O-antigen ligase family protein [Dehalococcoidia bacterium]
RQRKQLTSLLRLLIVAGFVASIIALALYAMESETANRLLNYLVPLGYPSGIVLRYIASTDTLRAIGTSADPNILGGTLVLIIPLALSQLFGEGSLFRRWQVVLMVAVMGLTMALTFSRGSWLGVVAAALFMSGLRYRKLLIILVVLGIALYFLPAGDLIVGRLESGIQVEDQAAAMRLGEYKDALHLISLYPWFGVGFGEAPSIDLYVAASSIYLLIAEEMGLVGLGAFLIIMVVLFTHAFTSLTRIAEPSLRTIQLGALAGVLGALTAGFFDHHFFNLDFPHTVALFWLMVGLVMVATRLGTQTNQEG